MTRAFFHNIYALYAYKKHVLNLCSQNISKVFFHGFQKRSKGNSNYHRYKEMNIHSSRNS